MNEVLRVFRHGRLAGVIRGADRIDYFRCGRGVRDGDRPLWGDTGRMLDGDPPAPEADLRAEQLARLRDEMLRGEGGLVLRVVLD